MARRSSVFRKISAIAAIFLLAQAHALQLGPGQLQLTTTPTPVVTPTPTWNGRFEHPNLSPDTAFNGTYTCNVAAAISINTWRLLKSVQEALLAAQDALKRGEKAKIEKHALHTLRYYMDYTNGALGRTLAYLGWNVLPASDPWVKASSHAVLDPTNDPLNRDKRFADWVVYGLIAIVSLLFVSNVALIAGVVYQAFQIAGLNTNVKASFYSVSDAMRQQKLNNDRANINFEQIKRRTEELSFEARARGDVYSVTDILEHQYKQLRFLPEFIRYADEHDFAHPTFTSEFVWEEARRIVNESTSWTPQVYGANATWHQHNQTIMIRVPTSCSELRNHISPTGEIDWPYLNSTTDQLETSIRIRVLESDQLDKAADQTKKSADNLSTSSITGIAFGGIGAMATVAGVVFTIIRHLRSSASGAAGSDSNQDETTANVGGNTTVINVNTKTDDDDDNHKNNLHASAPSHTTYPALPEQVFMGKGNDRSVNSANTQQVSSTARAVWSSFKMDPVKNNLSA
jgi:hypothetical protein